MLLVLVEYSLTAHSPGSFGSLFAISVVPAKDLPAIVVSAWTLAPVEDLLATVG